MQADLCRQKTGQLNCAFQNGSTVVRLCDWGDACRSGSVEGTEVVASIVSCLLYSNRESRWNLEKTLHGSH